MLHIVDCKSNGELLWTQ